MTKLFRGSNAVAEVVARYNDGPYIVEIAKTYVAVTPHDHGYFAWVSDNVMSVNDHPLESVRAARSAASAHLRSLRLR